MSQETVSIVVIDMVPINSKNLLALCDVAVAIHEVEFVLHGVQVTAEPNGTAVRLPKYRNANGEWMAAITMPIEIHEPMANAVLELGIDKGILRRTAVPPSPKR